MRIGLLFKTGVDNILKVSINKVFVHWYLADIREEGALFENR